MRVLVACEFSGIVRDAFRTRGHDAWSCDLQPCKSPGLHHQGDVLSLLDGWVPVRFQVECDPDGDGWCRVTDSDPNDCPCIGPTQDEAEYLEKDGVLFGRLTAHPHWDLMIAHPPCTHLACSGAQWFARKLVEQRKAIFFFKELANAPIPRICIENPVGIMSTLYRKPDQVIQPYFFGDEAQKTTCLWLKNLPPLQHAKEEDWFAPKTHVGKGEFVTFKSGKRHPKWYADALGSKDRSNIRSRTFPGIAAAMAEQWGEF